MPLYIYQAAYTERMACYVISELDKQKAAAG